MLLALRMFFAILFTIGYNDARCIMDLRRYSNRIKSLTVPNNWIGEKRLARLLAKMERCYYIYRTGNLKYNRTVDDVTGVSSGVLAFLRTQLKEIVLTESILPKVKMMAINILLAQQSNHTLYEIAHADKSIGQMIDEKSKTSVSHYVIRHFVPHSDHDMINLAFFWANNTKKTLALEAIDKTTSPKSLVTLSLFFRNNLNNMQYVGHIIDRLGGIIAESEYQLQNDHIDYVNESCDNEANWLHPHAKSMMYSTHTALEKIVTIFADENNNIYHSGVCLMQERELVRKAINTMVVPCFLQRIAQTCTDPIKAAWSEERLAAITNATIDDVVMRDRLIAGVCTDKELLEAIAYLDFNKEENRNVAHILAKRVDFNRHGIKYSPKLSDPVAHAFCLKYYGQHEYQPEKDTPNIATCMHCGKRINLFNPADVASAAGTMPNPATTATFSSDPNFLAQLMAFLSHGGFMGGFSPDAFDPFVSPPGHVNPPLPPVDDAHDQIIDIEIIPDD